MTGGMLICVLLILLLWRQPEIVDKAQLDRTTKEEQINKGVKKTEPLKPESKVNEHFALVRKLSTDTEQPDIKKLEDLLEEYLVINDELNKTPSYDSSIVKLMMSESVLNGIVSNLAKETDPNSIERVCSLLDSSKVLFVDNNYSIYILLRELGYSLEETPMMSATRKSYSSLGPWFESRRIIRTEDFKKRLREYSDSKGIPSLVELLNTPKSKIKKDAIPSNLLDYKGRPELSQYIRTSGIYNYWAKHKIYCIYKKLESQNVGDKLYDLLVAEASAEPWISKYSPFLQKGEWKNRIKLNPSKKIQALRIVDVTEL